MTGPGNARTLADLDARIQALVDAAPPLSDEVLARLNVLIACTIDRATQPR